jgi:iron transport multicopper oxidase
MLVRYEQNYAFFNGITYVGAKVPTLYTALSSGNSSLNPTIYGVNTNSYVIKHNEVVEIILNNQDPGKHPFHLHGHSFQSIVRGEEDSGDFDPESLTNGSLVLPKRPMRRDTLLVRPNGHIIMRFQATNPGVWIFHCHIEWHVDSGLTMTFIEDPLMLQETLTIPDDHYAACAALDPPMPTAGNAAANTVDLLDLTGANVSPDPLPAGFTARGIVALTFSIIAGLIGVGVIAWYGMGEMSNIEQERRKAKVDQVADHKGVAERVPSDAHVSAGAAPGGDGAPDTISTAR